MRTNHLYGVLFFVVQPEVVVKVEKLPRSILHDLHWFHVCNGYSCYLRSTVFYVFDFPIIFPVCGLLELGLLSGYG